MAVAFDRLDDRARRAFAFAQDEAVRFGHPTIGSEHLLIGVLREGNSAGAQVLRSLGLDLATLRRSLEATAGRGECKSDRIQLNEQASRSLEAASDEAQALGDEAVGTEHLALGVARTTSDSAISPLSAAGITFEALRARIIASRH